jgi:hypothetical protein
MTLTTLAQATKTLHRLNQDAAPADEAVAFVEPTDAAGPPTSMLLAYTTWLNLGEPDTITVAIERSPS